MALLSKAELNSIVGKKYESITINKSASKSAMLERGESTIEYDIFLSHSYLDRESVLQLHYLLQEILGWKVFVDWIQWPNRDRSVVTRETASELRSVMDRSASLVYAISANSSTSTWMQWELGYSDAKHNRVAIIPIADTTVAISYRGQEFVGLYPYADIAETADKKERHLWVNDPKTPQSYAKFNDWLKNGKLPNHS